MKEEDLKKEKKNENKTTKEKKEKCNFFKKKEVWISGIAGAIIGVALVFLLIYFGLPGFGHEAVLKFKGGKITEKDLSEEIKTQTERIKDYKIRLALNKAYQVILDEKYKLTDKDYEKINKQAKEFFESLKNQGYSEEESLKEVGFKSKEDLIKELEKIYKMDLYFIDYFKTIIPKEDIKNFYDEKVKFGEINTKHMLILQSNGLDDAGALKLANEIIEKLDNGENFDAVASEYADSVVFEHVDFDSFDCDTLAEEYVNTSKELEKDTYTKTPVETMYGYHIIYLIDKKDVPSFEEAEGDIVIKLSANLENRSKDMALVKLEEDYSIKFCDKKDQEEYDKFKKEIKGTE